MQKIKKISLKILLLIILLIPSTSFAAVIVDTLPATDITTTNARLKGNVFNTGSVGNSTLPAGTQAYFRYSTTSPLSCNNSFGTQTSMAIIGANGDFNKVITSLTPDTTYYFCAIAIYNQVPGMSISDEVLSFHTSSPSGNIPGATIGNVGTHPAINITDTETTFHGSVANLSGTVYGYFRYSALAIPPVFCNEIFGSSMKSVTATVPHASGQIDPGDFYGVAKNLKPNTVYYYCAVASNNAFNPTEIRYGDVVAFKTLPCATCDKTTMTTKKAIVTGNSKATLKGAYSSTKTVKTYFEYKKYVIQDVSASQGLNNGPGIGNGNNFGGPGDPTPIYEWIKVDEKTHTPVGSYGTYGNMSYNLSGLEVDTYYKVRAVGETSNPDETFYGDVLQFKTLKYNGVGPIPTIPGAGFCPAGTTGTPPNCVDINPNDDNDDTTCPLGTTGTPPNCTVIPLPTDFPTVDVIATPVPPPLLVTPINSWTISWTSTNATSCNSGGNGTGESGSFATGVLTSSHTYTVSCTGAQGSASDSVIVTVQTTTIPPLPTPYPIVTVTASPQTVDPDGTSVIGWSSENADTCNTGGHGTGTSGSFTTDPLTHSHTYTITCTNPIGTAAGAVSVYVDNGGNDPTGTLPSVTVTANPGSISTGESSTINWESSGNATSCNTQGHGTGTTDPVTGIISGSFSVGPLNNSHSYTVTCTNTNGTGADTANVIVDDGNTNTDDNDIPSVTILATPMTVNPLGTSIISWSANTFANSCNLLGTNSSGVPTGSFTTPGLTQSHTYTVVCTGVNGSTSDSVNVFVNDGDNGDNDDLPSVSIQATPMTVLPGGTSVISWSANTFATSCNVIGTNNSGVPTGSFTTPALNIGRTYTVVCTGVNGSTSDSVNIFIDYSGGGGNDGNQNNLPTVTLTANPTLVTIGGSSTISWSSQNTTSCNSGGHGTGTTGSFSTGPLQIGMSYTVTCTGPQGTGSSNVIVLVGVNGGGDGDPGDDGNPGDDNPGGGPVCPIDLDADGIINILDPDTDGDGILNVTDTDDDADGIPDLIDATPNCTGTPNDYDGGGIPNGNDSDIDGDGIPNVIDSDTDGDGNPNNTDNDDDNDGIPDPVDNSPTGPGTPNDYDGGGIPNGQDTDMDGDGFPNEQDSNTDGDGLPNDTDTDDDNDGIPDGTDPTPHGPTSTQGKVLKIGDIATPDIDDIVRYHEGVEHVFIRRIIKNVNLQKRYGYLPGSNLQLFAYDLAHTLAKQFGYVDGAGREIRVSKPDVSAYALRLSGNKLTVYEYYTNRIIDIRKVNAPFKNKNPYEYYFRK